jgi:hypothetical protein
LKPFSVDLQLFFQSTLAKPGDGDMSQAGGATFATSATALEQTKNIDEFVATVAIVARDLLAIRIFAKAPPRQRL